MTIKDCLRELAIDGKTEDGIVMQLTLNKALPYGDKEGVSDTVSISASDTLGLVDIKGHLKSI